MREKPGAQTAWPAINQLLGPDERFEVHFSDGKGFLLAPKQPSQLAALLYLLHQEKIPFCIQGKGSGALPSHAVIVSARAFSQMVWYDQGLVEVGAGTSLSHLHQFLLERRQEVAFEEAPLVVAKRSLAGLLLSGKTSELRYRSEGLPENILGIEWVTLEGSQVKWGGAHLSAVAGPTLQKLIWGLQTLPGVIVKIILKTYPLPPVRLRLAWTFRQREALWQHFRDLQQFSSTWECLEAVISGQPTDQGFIFAQMSGLPGEMEAFAHLCPGYAEARQQGERVQLRNFLHQQALKSYPVAKDHPLEPGEYLWMQEGSTKAWWLTPKAVEEKEYSIPLWKQRFWESFSLKNRI